MSAAATEEAEPAPGAAFLAALADPARPRLPVRVAVVVAHPDDETIGCGSQLSRFADVEVIHVTDGAPRNGADAAALGFADPADYAAARRHELEAAMALVGVPAERLVSLGIPDQEASLRLPAIATALADRLAGRNVVLTHAYEGGHPDHDATAWAVHAASALLAARGRAPLIVEMPLYRSGPDGQFTQGFPPDAAPPATELPLDWEAQQLKQQMYAAYGSQREMLLLFDVDVERFRIAPAYDFGKLPNSGDLYYERYDWGMTGDRWLQLAAFARAELRLGAAA